MFQSNLRNTIISAIFTALIAASAFITIPVGPVPIVLTNIFIILSGMLCGPWIGASSVLTYLILGAIGFPVFAGGSAGFAKLVGPTGGYLIGYLLAAFVVGFLFRPSKKTSKRNKAIFAICSALIAGAVIYVPGLLWLKSSLSMNWTTTLQVGLIPFIPGYFIKSAVAAALAYNLKDRFEEFLNKDEE